MPWAPACTQRKTQHSLKWGVRHSPVVVGCQVATHAAFYWEDGVGFFLLARHCGHKTTYIRQEKRAQNLCDKDKLFGSGDRPVGWGSSTRRGGGQKLRAHPRKFVFLGFRREESGMSQEFCRDVPDPWGCSKSLCKITSCAFLFPNTFIQILRHTLRQALQQTLQLTLRQIFRRLCDRLCDKLLRLTLRQTLQQTLRQTLRQLCGRLCEKKTLRQLCDNFATNLRQLCDNLATTLHTTSGTLLTKDIHP